MSPAETRRIGMPALVAIASRRFMCWTTSAWLPSVVGEDRRVEARYRSIDGE
jgi:hypothetical protein